MSNKHFKLWKGAKKRIPLPQSDDLDWNLLKKLYKIHSPSGREDRMIKFLISYLKTIPGVRTAQDAYGNLYALKGKSESYPCIVSHLDQVQKLHSPDFQAMETRDIIFGYSPKNRRFEGLGCDDKNGIFIAIEALKRYDCLKAVFFKEEETGCRGSNNAELTFFDDCLYVLQCDRRGNSDFITTIGFTDLCSHEFISAVNPERWGYREENGLMTDVEALKENGLSVSACNISCGYYNHHTDQEITVKRDLLKCWRFVKHIIEDCTDIYPHQPSLDYDYYGGYYLDEVEAYEMLWNEFSLDPHIPTDLLYDNYKHLFPGISKNYIEEIRADYLFNVEQWEDTPYVINPLKPNENEENKENKNDCGETLVG